MKPTIKKDLQKNSTQNLKFKNLISFYRFLKNTPLNYKGGISKSKYEFIYENIKEKLSINKRTKDYIKRLLNDNCETGKFFYFHTRKTQNEKQKESVLRQCLKLDLTEQQTNDFYLFFKSNNLLKKQKRIKKYLNIFLSCYNSKGEMLQKRLDNYFYIYNNNLDKKINFTVDIIYKIYSSCDNKFKKQIPKDKPTNSLFNLLDKSKRLNLFDIERGF